MTEASDGLEQRPDDVAQPEERRFVALALVWVAALLALIPGAAASSGVTIATSLFVMGAVTVVGLVLLAVVATRLTAPASAVHHAPAADPPAPA